MLGRTSVVVWGALILGGCGDSAPSSAAEGDGLLPSSRTPSTQDGGNLGESDLSAEPAPKEVSTANPSDTDEESGEGGSTTPTDDSATPTDDGVPSDKAAEDTAADGDGAEQSAASGAAIEEMVMVGGTDGAAGDTAGEDADGAGEMPGDTEPAEVIEPEDIGLDTPVTAIAFGDSFVAECVARAGETVRDVIDLFCAGGSYDSLGDASGIEYLTELRTLELRNFYGDGVDFSKNTKLEELALAGNVQELILPNGLRSLHLQFTTSLTELDLSGQPSLETLSLYDTGLTTIDLSVVPRRFILSRKRTWMVGVPTGV